MDEFLTYLTQNILAHSDEIELDSNETDYAYEYTIKVPQSEYGSLIGKKGKTISAIRILSNLYLYNKSPDGPHKRLFLKVEEK